MIVAHSDGASIRLSNGRLIPLSPSDIANLHFTKKPFVFLRVCQGQDVGFADAFVKAGARGVWTNRGSVSAATANQQAGEFLKLTRAGTTIEDAIRKMMEVDRSIHQGTALFARN